MTQNNPHNEMPKDERDAHSVAKLKNTRFMSQTFQAQMPKDTVEAYRKGLVQTCNMSGIKMCPGCGLTPEGLDEIRTTAYNKGVEVGKKDYNELIMAVGNKFDGETRHETALRYIKQAEQRPLEDRKSVV